jgi:uncharacterized protein YoxC
MKVTKDYLQQVIKEEMELMVQEGQIDEISLGPAFKKIKSKIGGDISDKVSAVAQKGAQLKAKAGEKISALTAPINKAYQDSKAYGASVINLAKQASTAGDIAKLLTASAQNVKSTKETAMALSQKLAGLGMVLDGIEDLSSSLEKAEQELQKFASMASAAAAEEE